MSRVSLCNPSCPEAYYIDYAGSELTEIHLLPNAGIKGMYSAHDNVLVYCVLKSCFSFHACHFFLALLLNNCENGTQLIFSFVCRSYMISKLIQS